MYQQRIHLTAFITTYALFEFTTTPFGLVNVRAKFSGLMGIMLLGMDGVYNFIDYIMVLTDTLEEHIKVLTELFVRLRNVELTVRQSKCVIAYSELVCLRRVIGQQRLKPEEKKIECVKNTQILDTKKQLS